MLERCMYLGGMRIFFPSFPMHRMKLPRSLSSLSSPTPFDRSPAAGVKSVPVAIVGAGPAGLTLSGLLSQYGVPSILLEKSSALPTHPQAHFINVRSMEILRHAFGGLDRAVLERCPPREEWRDFVMCSTVLGRQLARVDNFSGGEVERGELSPTSVAHLSQNILLPLLLQEAQHAADEFCPTSQILFDVEATGIRLSCSNKSEDCRHLELQSRGGYSGNAAVAADSDAIKCDYVVAADGAGSSMRMAAGIGLSGRGELGHLVNIHFRCKGLDRLLRARGQGPGMLYFVYNEETICVLVAHNVQKGEYACQIPFFPPYQTAESFTEDLSISLIRHALGLSGPELDIEVCSIRPWTMNALVADEYFSGILTARSRQKSGGGEAKEIDACNGGVFLIGDAAHQFPPAGGFGLNTGVQDAHNLAWKLAAVHHGIAPPDILLTYGQERRPVAMRNATLSVRNLKRSLRVLETLGVDPNLGASASVMDRLVRSPLTLNWEEGLSGMVASMWDFQERSNIILRLGRRQLESLRREGHPYGEARVRSLRRLLAEGGGLPLLFPDHDVGFVYGKGAMVQPGEDKSLPSRKIKGDVSQKKQAIRGVVVSSPSSSASSLRLGGRMPHFVLRPMAEKHVGNFGEGRKASESLFCSALSLSTVDLPDQLRRLRLFDALHSQFSEYPLVNASKTAVDGEETLSSLLPPSGAARAPWASLASVLVVAAQPVDSAVSINPGRLQVEKTASALTAQDIRSRSKWLNAAICVQRGDRGVESTVKRQCQDSYASSILYPPLIVLTVSPTPDLTTFKGSPSRSLHEKEQVGKNTGRREAFLRGDRASSITSAAEGQHPKNLEAILSRERLEPYMDHERSTVLNSLKAQRAVNVLKPSMSTDECISKLAGRKSEGTEGPAIVLSMRAMDDSVGNLSKAFGSAGVEAVLLRPDGHVSWMAPWSNPLIEAGEEYDPVRELRRALDAIYSGGGGCSVSAAKRETPHV